MSQFNIEKSRWEAEVDAEAAKLVRGGYPPYRAIHAAKQIVCNRRKIEDLRKQELRRKVSDERFLWFNN